MSEPLGMVHRVEQGVLRVVFDRPGERVNLLSETILRELDRLLEQARGRDDLRALLFSSTKPAMFIAGMDVEQIANVMDGHRAAEGARYAQQVFAKIGELGLPSAAAINGVCLGGGLELALACDFRLAADDPAVSIGLPEVQLGIIPGFGGSQRLPRLIGLTRALDLILSGRRVGAREARRLGLIDLMVPAAYLEREALKLLQQASERGRAATALGLRQKRAWSSTLIERIGPVRRQVVTQAKHRAGAKADPRFYPAPQRAADAVEAAFALAPSQGYDLEARIVGELVPTPTSKNLIGLFQAQTVLKSDGAQGVAAVPRRVRRVAVLGAGIMGGGIAHLAADNGLLVRLKDVRQDALLMALRTARGLWHKQVERKRLTPRELEQKMAAIAPTLGDSGLARVDLVIEAVVENLEVKQSVLAQVEARVGDRAVFASNTSSLPIGDIAARALRPERVVGLHFFNPVHRMPLVEVIAGPASSPEAVATVRAVAVRLGKVPVVVRDGPGFLVNRILTFYINEALRLLMEGLRIEAVDRAMTSFGMPVGPFLLLDQVGLDTARHVGEVLQAAFGKRAASATDVLGAMVTAGRLGEKSGRGFYRHGARAAEPDDQVGRLVGAASPRELPAETLQERLVLPMVNEAALCLEEEVVREPRDVDVGMVMGTGFPPFRGGLLRYADAVGLPIMADRLARLADAHGERFRPAGLLLQMVRDQRRFYPAR